MSRMPLFYEVQPARLTHTGRRKSASVKFHFLPGNVGLDAIANEFIGSKVTCDRTLGITSMI